MANLGCGEEDVEGGGSQCESMDEGGGRHT